MKMFEKLKVGTGVPGYVTDGELKRAMKVYDRYVDFLTERYGDNYGTSRDCTAVSLAEFLLQDVSYQRLDSFMWDKGVLVKTDSGAIGVTVGWCLVGCFSVCYGIKVRTAAGTQTAYADNIEKADIPPEVLDYVKSVLQDKVHGKVDEAFKEN